MVSIKEMIKHFEKLNANFTEEKPLSEDIECNRMIEAFFSKPFKDQMKH